MITELKRWRLICNNCKKEVIVEDTYFKYPEGWTEVAIGPCGTTNYYRELDLCPECSKIETNKT